MTDAPLPPEVYYASLPKHLVSAAVIIRDDQDRVLLVQPTYRTDTWEIPGGSLDHGEHPWQAAHREVMEELGLAIEPGKLLAVDWRPPQPDRRPALCNFLFDGGRLTAEQINDIRLPADELASWRFCTTQERSALLLPHMADRVNACIKALAGAHTAYLHCGQPVSGYSGDSRAAPQAGAARRGQELRSANSMLVPKRAT